MACPDRVDVLTADALALLAPAVMTPAQAVAIAAAAVGSVLADAPDAGYRRQRMLLTAAVEQARTDAVPSARRRRWARTSRRAREELAAAWIDGLTPPLRRCRHTLRAVIYSRPGVPDHVEDCAWCTEMTARLETILDPEASQVFAPTRVVSSPPVVRRRPLPYPRGELVSSRPSPAPVGRHSADGRPSDGRSADGRRAG